MTKPKVRAALAPEERHAKPTDSDEWPSRLQNAIRAQIRSVRLERGLTFDALSDRCRDLGYPISRVVLSKIEAGFRPSLSVPELLVIAGALDIPPIQVLAPSGDVIEVMPGRRMKSQAARRWLAGSTAKVCPRCGSGLPSCTDTRPDGTKYTHEETCATYEWDVVVCAECSRHVAAMPRWVTS